MPETRYSPKPISAYGMSAGSRLLCDDVAAWNLAYLSWDIENHPMWPDAHFSTNVRRTVQFVIADGAPDITGRTPSKDCVRGYFLQPPPRAVYLLQKMKYFSRLPMYVAYGEPWRETLIKRSQTYREDFDKLLDLEAVPTQETIDLINRLK